MKISYLLMLLFLGVFLVNATEESNTETDLFAEEEESAAVEEDLEEDFEVEDLEEQSSKNSKS